MRRKDDEEILGLSKQLFLEASEYFKVAPSAVTTKQFLSISNGRLGYWSLSRLGGVVRLKEKFFGEGRIDCNPYQNCQNHVYTDGAQAKTFGYIKPSLTGFKRTIAPLDDVFKSAGADVVRCIVQPDTHVPLHDKAAVNAFMKFCAFYRPHLYINLGDFLEMEAVSPYPARNFNPRRIVPDVLEAKDVMHRLIDAMGPQCKARYFLLGNHEDWLMQYLTERVPELADGLEALGVSLRIESMLGLDKLGFEVIDINKILRVGSANFIHGYYTPCHHAKKHLDIFKDNIYYGHLHDVQVHPGVSASGYHEAMSLGCLRQLDAEFLRGKPTNWAHAFGIFEFRRDGTYTRMAPIIIDGRFSFNGVLYDGNT